MRLWIARIYKHLFRLECFYNYLPTNKKGAFLFIKLVFYLNYDKALHNVLLLQVLFYKKAFENN